MSSGNALAVDGLVKTYEHGRALDTMSFTVPRSDLRLFGKPVVDGARRMGVALARTDTAGSSR